MKYEEFASQRSIEVSTDHLSNPELKLIVGFFGRHHHMVTDVSAYHDLETKELRFSAVPSVGVSDTDAEIALNEAIRAARTIKPSDNLDMSA